MRRARCPGSAAVKGSVVGRQQVPARSLDERYGRRAPGAARRWPLVVAGVLLLALAVGWGLWVARTVAAQPVTWQDVGFAVRGDERTEVTFDVRFDGDLPADADAVCTLRALNQVRAEVGLVDVTVGPASRGTIRTTASVPTSERAVTGLVKECVVARR
jgi:hypothetical protein